MILRALNGCGLSLELHLVDIVDCHGYSRQNIYFGQLNTQKKGSSQIWGKRLTHIEV